jgi:hypothetical protein
MTTRPAGWRAARRVMLGSAVLALTGCASSAPPAPPPTPSRSVSPAASSAATAAATPEAGTQNLVAGSTVKAALLAAFAAMKGLPQDEVTGPLPGSVYYGIDGPTGTYWAVARFELTSSAPMQAAVGMQDGGNIGVFTSKGGQAWAVHTGGIPFGCPGELPPGLMSVWGMTSPGICGLLSASSPARAKATIASALNLPAGTYFGAVLYEGLALDGNGSIFFEPESWQGNSGPASPSHTFYSLSFGPSAVAGYWTGTSRSASHEVLGRFDLAFARRVESAMVPFLTQPTSGYVVTVFVPAGCSGGCSQLSKIVQMDSVAPLPAHPDFTVPSG